MITIKIDESELLKMLNDRVAFWTNDEKTQRLFDQMYNAYIDSGLFDDLFITRDIKATVDDDYNNYCQVVDDNELAKIDEHDIDIEAEISYIDGKHWTLIRWCNK